MFRTDANHNPAAFTTDVAAEAGLIEGTDYTRGTQFPPDEHGKPVQLWTANLMGDPVALTIRVIDKIGYKEKSGTPRWTYINMPKFVWDALTPPQKRDVVGYHYRHEGGTAMRHLFPNYSAT